jgi:hypothetical protein
MAARQEQEEGRDDADRDDEDGGKDLEGLRAVELSDRVLRPNEARLTLGLPSSGACFASQFRGNRIALLFRFRLQIVGPAGVEALLKCADLDDV